MVLLCILEVVVLACRFLVSLLLLPCLWGEQYWQVHHLCLLERLCCLQPQLVHNQANEGNKLIAVHVDTSK